MIADAHKFYISPEEYLAGERVSPIKQEYRHGYVYAMVGAKKAHIILASNLIFLLGNHLQNSPCLVLSSDIKVRLEIPNCYYYPDVAVTCDWRDRETLEEDFILYPALVIEILSKSTESFDWGEKFADYQTSTCLREYVLVHQEQVKIEVYRLNEAKDWEGQMYGLGDEVDLKSVDFQCAIASIYNKVM